MNLSDRLIRPRRKSILHATISQCLSWGKCLKFLWRRATRGSSNTIDSNPSTRGKAVAAVVRPKPTLRRPGPPSVCCTLQQSRRPQKRTSSNPLPWIRPLKCLFTRSLSQRHLLWMLEWAVLGGQGCRIRQNYWALFNQWMMRSSKSKTNSLKFIVGRTPPVCSWNQGPSIWTWPGCPTPGHRGCTVEPWVLPKMLNPRKAIRSCQITVLPHVTINQIWMLMRMSRKPFWVLKTQELVLSSRWSSRTFARRPWTWTPDWPNSQGRRPSTP